ncbi:hypothetical protein [Bradyrhizobium arachidis]|uniref:Uncharacterized protein n=1 Tax=Bradyrhizobium arachidis TaxID=858423 RepID=A0AAE7NRF8_9BRAD|nr:hypothetical protein [Bradyrhizobium arachidis]QOZ70649.1 hypothetical protein WN72_33350 [Bradyrhizobium arachidis]
MPRPIRRHTPTHADGRPLTITFGEMREMGLRDMLVYCHCGHHVALSADRWPDDVRLSDIEPRFVCKGCGARGADIRPDFERGDGRLAIVDHWNLRSTQIEVKGANR